MERFGNREAPARGPEDALTGEPAVRDAAAILARVAADESAAGQARDRYRTQPMPKIEPDRRIAPLLWPDERVVAVRLNAAFDRRQARPREEIPLGVAGSLYVTTRRLVLVGRVTLSLALDEIDEIGLSAERVVLVVRDGSSLSVDVAQPRLLRVEIGAARASSACAPANAEGPAQAGSR